jgi:hypothetical protein
MNQCTNQAHKGDLDQFTDCCSSITRIEGVWTINFLVIETFTLVNAIHIALSYLFKI